MNVSYNQRMTPDQVRKHLQQVEQEYDRRRCLGMVIGAWVGIIALLVLGLGLLVR